MMIARRGARLIAVVAVLLLGVLAGTGGSAAATPGVPYTDPDAVGYIGLCNQAGQQITSGSVTTTPFAWRAVSSEPAPAGYNGSSRTATLTAYLPIQVLPPGDWSGEQLTASSRYSNPDNPMAAATSNDESLQTFIEDFPPEWDGFIQLRLFLSSANQQALSTRYPALDIQVTGTTWQAIGGGTVNCNSGTSESLESIVLPTAATAPAKGTASGKGTGSDTSSGSAGGSGGSGKGTGSSGGANGSGSPTGKGTSSGAHPRSSGAAVPLSVTTDHAPFVTAIAVAALAVLATLIFLFLRRRRHPDPTPPTPTTSS